MQRRANVLYLNNQFYDAIHYSHNIMMQYTTHTTTMQYTTHTTWRCNRRLTQLRCNTLLTQHHPRTTHALTCTLQQTAAQTFYTLTLKCTLQYTLLTHYPPTEFQISNRRATVLYSNTHLYSAKYNFHALPTHLIVHCNKPPRNRRVFTHSMCTQ